ncbi:MAG: 30S ribosomal protein S12 methylthiotransferase RimO [Nitriliruptorales bacterium]
MAGVAIVTLGCARNEVDSDQLAAVLTDAGHALVEEPADADVVLVNTCTFITPATEESVDTVLAACDLKEDGGARAVLAVGCMAERYQDELAASIPELDAVVGFAAYPRLAAIVDDLLAGRDVPRFVGARSGPDGRRLPVAAAGTTAQDDLDRIPASGPRFPRRRASGAPWAYLKIASGCDRACTFCAIPSWRGGFRSRPLEELVAEAGWLAAQGAKELVLVSENTTSWGKDLPGGRALQPRLLDELAAVDGVERLRLVYLQPDELTDDLVRAMAGNPVVAPYFDLSLQHASAPILTRMARSGSRQRFLDLVGRIRALDPSAVFRSNFIVGFPGETDADAAELASFLEEAQLDWVGLFGFSPQEGTRAETLAEPVADELVLGRLSELSDLQEAVADARSLGFVGRRLEVIVEEVGEDGATGRSYREAPETDGEIRLVVSGDGGPGDWRPATLPVGRTVSATVVAAEGVDLLAVPDHPEDRVVGVARV